MDGPLLWAVTDDGPGGGGACGVFVPGFLFVMFTAGVAVVFVEHDVAAGCQVGADPVEHFCGGGVEVAVDVDQADVGGDGVGGQGVGE